MDPRTYCEQALDELLARGADLAADQDGTQRGAVLSYLAQLRLSEHDFAGELKRLSMRATRERRPTIAAAARAILLDWEARADQGTTRGA